MRPTPDRHEIARARELIAALEPRLAGEARFDLYTRTLYATDASIYRVMPLGVVLPRNADDVVAAVEIARQHGVPLVPRGGGSSLAGQAVGAGLVIDFSRWMDRVISLDVERRRVTVEPGVVLATLNRALAAHGLMVGPDPASADRATIGGMIGNDATGAHSILYGMMHDHLGPMRVLVADGTTLDLDALDRPALEARMGAPGREGDLYRATRALVDRHREAIVARYPRHWRRASGYGLDRLLDAEDWHLGRLLAGSEGTLAVTLAATLDLVSRPRLTALGLLHFETLEGAMAAVPGLLESSPAAIELIDRSLLRLTRGVPEYARRLDFVEGDPAAILVVEYFGDSAAELEARLAQLRAVAGTRPLLELVEPAAIASVWAVRKAGLGLLMSTTGDWKAIPFIEDGAVPPERLDTFVREMQRILAEYRTEASFYAHASAGCLHVRPLINLKREEGVATMRAIAERWCDLIVELGGATTGEHGDGRARSEWLPRLFGTELFHAFHDLKAIWDPDALLNPGNLVEPRPIEADLRVAHPYRIHEPATRLSFEREGGFGGAVELCNGMALCRKTTSGTMCPSFMATREEEHSTRGRANALRSALAGQLPREELLSPRMYEVLDLCLECKACRAECPSQVDMAKIKYEWLHHYYRTHGLPLRSRLFGNIRALNRWGSRVAPLANGLARSPLAPLVQRLVGIAPERRLPALARQPFDRWLARHEPDPAAGTRGEIVLYADTFTLYNYPEVGIAATRLIESAGYRVLLPEPLSCCGRPMISKGMLDEALRLARLNLKRLLPHVRAGRWIVGLEPSCLLTLREELPDLLQSHEAREVASRAVMVDEWLLARSRSGELELRWKDEPRRLLFHAHCHHRAAGIADAVAALALPPGNEVTLLDAGCCGMAGAFGFEREHYDMSVRIAAQRLLPALDSDPGAGVAISGVSCRQQIAALTDRRPRHLVEWLADALDPV